MACLFALTLLACAACGGETGAVTGPNAAAGSDAGAGPTCTAQALEAPRQCASTVVEGIDVFDGQGAIDWSAAAASPAPTERPEDGGAVPPTGVRFAFIKATQGLGNTQTTFAANWAGAAAAHVARGAYHFFDPRDDGVAQANHFLTVVGAASLEAVGSPATELPPMVDIECPDGDPDCLGTGSSGEPDAGGPDGGGPAIVRQRLQDWLDTVERATGRRPIVYTFSSYFTSNRIDPTGLDRYPLFLAYPTTATCFAVPAPWSRATLWQYSWTGQVDGVAAAVDRDRFLGGVADLLAFAGGSTQPPVGADAAAYPAPDAAVDTAAPGPSTDRDPPDAAAFPGPAAEHCL